MQLVKKQIMSKFAKYCFTRFSYQKTTPCSFNSALLCSQVMSSSGGPSKKYTKEELKKRLTPMQYHVTQEKGTERPFTGEYEQNKKKGEYRCVVCGNLLFKSDHKYESGSGWPSFYQTATDGAVERIEDRSHGMKRVEVVCKDCSAHLGHVFEDGPQPSGERFCMNSASLAFKKK